jgi:hypothetical protein
MKQLRHWFRPRTALAVFALAFCLVYIVVLPLLKLYTYPLVYFYQEGSCTINGKELQTLGGGDADPTYLAHFEYTIHAADGRSARGNSQK